MKYKGLIFVISMILLISCRNKSDSEMITQRNKEVTPENAYNDMFLDSMDVADFIKKNKLPRDTTSRIISFYNSRNYEFAWFSTAGFSEQALGFISLLNLSEDSSSKKRGLLSSVEDMMAESNLRPGAKNSRFINTEISLTQRLIEYTENQVKENADRNYAVEHLVPSQKSEPMVLAENLVDQKKKRAHLILGENKPYHNLLLKLEKYVELAKSDKWQPIPVPAKKLKPGKYDSVISEVKNNLFLLGDLTKMDTSSYYGDSLALAVIEFQKRHGLTPDGELTPSVIELLNLKPIDLVEKILINLQRMQWLPSEQEGKLIEVNIPAFTLKAYENNKPVFSMPVVVGKEGHNTVMFADEMENIVFSPYWNIPQSIVKKEILPAMEKNSHYLEQKHMEKTGEEDGYPVIRQLPGPWNSLGKVKFLFPNSFNIYLHDTPAKSLFSEDERAYSHGCIRVAEPAQLAGWLLEGDNNWTSEKIETAMNADEEKWVKVTKPAEVIITYYTAVASGNGVLSLYQDIYGHDEAMAHKMFK